MAAPLSEPVLVLVRDLIFSSRINATAQAIGVAATVIRDPAKLAGEAGRLLLVDLNLEGAIDAAAAWRTAVDGRRAVGFVSHVDAETARRAKQAGIDQILARSRFVEELETILKSPRLSNTSS